MSLRHAFLLALSLQAPLAPAASVTTSVETNVAATITPSGVTIHAPAQAQVLYADHQNYTAVFKVYGKSELLRGTCKDAFDKEENFRSTDPDIVKGMKDIYIKLADELFVSQNPPLTLDDPTGQMTMADAGAKYIDALAADLQTTMAKLNTAIVGACASADYQRLRNMVDSLTPKEKPFVALLTPKAIELYQDPTSYVEYDGQAKSVTVTIAALGASDTLKMECDDVIALRDDSFSGTEKGKAAIKAKFAGVIAEDLKAKQPAYEVEGHVNKADAERRLHAHIIDRLWRANILGIGIGAANCEDNSASYRLERLLKQGPSF